jgi:hypothetical protein
MIPNGYKLVVGVDGCRYRRYLRWTEIPPVARLPEHHWPLRWDLAEHCTVAVPNKARARDPRFHPCGWKRSSGADLCIVHARKEQHPLHYVTRDSE